MVARTASTEKGSQQSPTRITPPQPAESAVRTMVPRLPGSRTACRATQQGAAAGSRSSNAVKVWAKTPITVCGFSRRETFSRISRVTSTTSPPALLAASAARCSRGWPAASGPCSRMRGAWPVSIASVTIFSPSARNRPLSSRSLRMCRARTAFTVEFDRDVMRWLTPSTARRTTGPRPCRAPPRSGPVRPSRCSRRARTGSRASGCPPPGR